MVKVLSADLTGKISSIGQLHFITAEWWKEASRFVVFKVSVNGRDRRLRLDMDKLVFLDQVGDRELDKQLESLAPSLPPVIRSLGLIKRDTPAQAVA